MGALMDANPGTAIPETVSDPLNAPPSSVADRMDATIGELNAPNKWYAFDSSLREHYQGTIDKVYSTTGKKYKNPFAYDEWEASDVKKYGGNEKARKDGRELELIQASRAAREINPDVPLAEEQRAYVQAAGERARNRASSLVDTGSGFSNFLGGSLAGLVLDPLQTATLAFPVSRLPLAFAEGVAGGALRNIGKEALLQGALNAGVSGAENIFDRMKATNQRPGEAFLGTELPPLEHDSIVKDMATGFGFGAILGAVFRGAHLALGGKAKDVLTPEQRAAGAVLEANELYGPPNSGLVNGDHEAQSQLVIDQIAKGQVVDTASAQTKPAPVGALAKDMKTVEGQVTYQDNVGVSGIFDPSALPELNKSVNGQGEGAFMISKDGKVINVSEEGHDGYLTRTGAKADDFVRLTTFLDPKTNTIEIGSHPLPENITTAQASILRQVKARVDKEARQGGNAKFKGSELDSIKADDKIVDLTGMGSAVVDNLYIGLFDSLTKGKSTFAGLRDPILIKAKAAFDAGEIKTPADLKAWVAKDGETAKKFDRVGTAKQETIQLLLDKNGIKRPEEPTTSAPAAIHENTPAAVVAGDTAAIPGELPGGAGHGASTTSPAGERAAGGTSHPHDPKLAAQENRVATLPDSHIEKIALEANPKLKAERDTALAEVDRTKKLLNAEIAARAKAAEEAPVAKKPTAKEKKAAAEEAKKNAKPKRDDYESNDKYAADLATWEAKQTGAPARDKPLGVRDVASEAQLDRLDELEYVVDAHGVGTPEGKAAKKELDTLKSALLKRARETKPAGPEVKTAAQAKPVERPPIEEFEKSHDKAQSQLAKVEAKIKAQGRKTKTALAENTPIEHEPEVNLPEAVDKADKAIAAEAAADMKPPEGAEPVTQTIGDKPPEVKVPTEGEDKVRVATDWKDIKDMVDQGKVDPNLEVDGRKISDLIEDADRQEKEANIIVGCAEGSNI